MVLDDPYHPVTCYCACALPILLLKWPIARWLYRPRQVETRIFAPTADPLPGGAGRPKSNQLEMVTTFTYISSLVKNTRKFELSLS